ncbi:HEAT repeat-containing protein [Toxoplasma gondii TgCatPRC2]|nr:HEAT repeat-containing protein [Toxoplasma gondii MAS]KFH03780.1 HEAT repeat-containing protein [Toxoplasma gondii VAND]KYK62368.1 HEAT repeat-containing protein [Toxoplasma gondii TgCatPRC2]
MLAAELADGGEEEDVPTLQRVCQLANSSVPVQRVLSVSLLVDFLADSVAAATVPRGLLQPLLYGLASLPPPAPPPSRHPVSPRQDAPPTASLPGSSAACNACSAGPAASGVGTPELAQSAAAPEAKAVSGAAGSASTRSFSFLFSGVGLGGAFPFRFGEPSGKKEKAESQTAEAVAAVRKALCARSGDIAACLIQADPEQG